MEIGQRSSCGPQILGHAAADGRVKGSTAVPIGHENFARKKNGIFENLRYIAKYCEDSSFRKLFARFLQGFWGFYCEIHIFLQLFKLFSVSAGSCEIAKLL